MYNFCLAIFNLLVITPSGDSIDDGNAVVDPLYNALNIILPAAMGIVLLSGTLYAVALGVQYSRAEDSEKRNAAKKKMVNAIIGFGIALVLIAVLYAIRGPIVKLINS